MTGELSVAVMIGKWSEKVVEIFRIIVSCPDPPTHVKRGSGFLSDTSCHQVDVVVNLPRPCREVLVLIVCVCVSVCLSVTVLAGAVGT